MQGHRCTKRAIITTSIGLLVGKFGAEYTHDELFRALDVGADNLQRWRPDHAGDTVVSVRPAPNAVIAAAPLRSRGGPNGKKHTPVLVRKSHYEQLVAIATLLQTDTDSGWSVFDQQSARVGEYPDGPDYELTAFCFLVWPPCARSATDASALEVETLSASSCRRYVR